jgi:uncharacterized protein YggE
VRVRVGVLSISESLPEARQENARVSTAVLDAIEGLKYPDIYVKSVGFDVSTLVEDKSSRDLEPPRIIGYQVRNALTIRMTNAEPSELSQRAASVLDTAVANGANEVGNIEVFVLDQDKHKKQALIEAVLNAKDKAEALAQTLEVRIVGYQSVSAQDVDYYMPRRDNVLMQSVAPSGGGTTSTPVEAGLVQITARASLQCLME